MTRLDGKTALVTGSGRGIGRAIASRLAQEGADVVVNYGQHEDEAQETLAQVVALGRRGTIVRADLAQVNEVRSLIEEGIRHFDGVDILVNNAGQAASAPIGRTSDELWQQMLAVNLTGTFLCARAALPGMLMAGWGRIVNISSTAGQRGYAYVSAYAAAKHGVIGLTRSLALEVASKGITINAVCPGYTETDLLRSSVDNVVAKTGRGVEQARAEFARHNPQGRIIQPEEVASAVAWLCGAGASAINGQSISVSGGEVM